ncbi:hypothetical protein QR685DRAFT_61526 [Neurospora intermedia]|uniref:Uncharacterized protein n=1 Tax=Neurospora intermedia TaxID=5142 RepID=A0ABR3DU24_NEUIN
MIWMIFILDFCHQMSFSSSSSSSPPHPPHPPPQVPSILMLKRPSETREAALVDTGRRMEVLTECRCADAEPDHEVSASRRVTSIWAGRQSPTFRVGIYSRPSWIRPSGLQQEPTRENGPSRVVCLFESAKQEMPIQSRHGQHDWTGREREIREVPDISGMVLEHHIKDSSVPGPTAAVHHGRRLSLGVLQIRQVVDIGLLSRRYRRPSQIYLEAWHQCTDE